jgi:FPC/CPF motif-containing protein YcgG
MGPWLISGVISTTNIGPAKVIRLNQEMGCGWQPRIFSSEQMNRMIAEDPSRQDWRIAGYRELACTLVREHFPCPFAQKSYQRSSQWFAFLESLEPRHLEHLRRSLLDYLHVFRRATSKFRVLMPFAVLVHSNVSSHSLEEAHRSAWAVLQYLVDNDITDWPSDVPKEPEHHLWSFCFGGEQLFVNFSSPVHRVRRSRNLGSYAALIINPRKNFDLVAGNTPEGHAIRGRIRTRIKLYDGVEHTHELGTYGQLENREWRQYAAAEPDNPLPTTCPLRIGDTKT